MLLMGLFVFLLIGTLLFYAISSINTVGNFATEELTTVQQAQAEEMLKTAALRAKTEVQYYLGESVAVVDSFAKVMSDTSINNNGQPLSREEVRTLTQSILKSAPNMNALYAQFEINAYDGRDADNIGNSRHSSDLGTLDTYWVLEDGDYVFYDSVHEEKYYDERDDYGNREAEWYLCSYETSKHCVLDPYLYEITETSFVLMTSYVAPVLQGTTFLGVVGGDINLPEIEAALADISETLMKGTGDITMTSEKGLIVGSTEQADIAGLSMQEAGLDLSTNINGLIKSDNYWAYSIPFQIGQAEQEWRVIVRVPTQALFASTLKLRAELSDKVEKTVVTVLLIAMLIAFIGLALLFFLVKTITSPLSEIARKMAYLATNNGDLTQRLDQQKHKELNDLVNGFNSFSEKLRDMIVRLMNQRDVVATSNTEFTQATAVANDATHRQAEQVDSVVTAVTEMASTANEVSSLASENSSAAREISGFLGETTVLVEKNRDMVEELATRLVAAGDQVGKVSQSSDAIYGILDTIRSIAEQTNLLALNAAIEAARAGEQGRGFAVVADEVRSLAARTAQSTEEVDVLIKTLQKDVNEAVTLIEGSKQDVESTAASTIESTEKITEVNRRLARISDNTMQVASVAKEQSNVAEQVNQSLVLIGDSSTDLSDIVSSLKRNNTASVSAVEELTKILSLLKV
ncbi:MAG: methyl-accepting chemotaxis protein [Reinekea sp.]|jgi:methyl-accepting chemotaxis protein